MIKKSAKGKAASTKVTRPKSGAKSALKKPRVKRQANGAEVRNDIAKIVKSGARKITKAVMDQAMTGQLAQAKYLFEVAGVFPAPADGSEASTDEECFAKTLLDRLNLPDKPVVLDEEDEVVKETKPGVGNDRDEKELKQRESGKGTSSSDANDEEGSGVSV